MMCALALEQRFKGDRTGACIAGGRRDRRRADRDGLTIVRIRKSQRPCDEHTAFEIGSVTKTMTTATARQNSLRAATSRWVIPSRSCLPPGTVVPSF